MIAQASTRRYPLVLVRVLRIALFAVLVAISARIRIEIPPAAPITAQTLAVFITGMALGPVEGALSLAMYLGSIALGLPLDARGLGTAAFAGPTVGYLWGFLAGSAIAGLAWRAPARARYGLSVLAGLAAALVILILGTLGWAAITHVSVRDALIVTVYPFVLIEPGKVLLAASLVFLGQESWARWILPHGTSGDPRA